MSIDNIRQFIQERAKQSGAKIDNEFNKPFVSTMLKSFAINMMNINRISNIKKARKRFGWSSYRLFALNSGLK